MLMLSSAPMMRSAPIMMSEPAPVEADVKPLDMSEVQGNVVPTGGLAGVKPTYESGVSEPAPEPEPAAPTSTSRPAYVWNPQNLDVPKLPDIPGAKLFEQQFVGEYLKDSPSYLTGALEIQEKSRKQIASCPHHPDNVNVNAFLRADDALRAHHDVRAGPS